MSLLEHQPAIDLQWQAHRHPALPSAACCSTCACVLGRLRTPGAACNSQLPEVTCIHMMMCFSHDRSEIPEPPTGHDIVCRASWTALPLLRRSQFHHPCDNAGLWYAAAGKPVCGGCEVSIKQLLHCIVHDSCKASLTSVICSMVAWQSKHLYLVP